MRTEIMNKNIELTTKKSSYVHSLMARNDEIEKGYYDRAVSASQLKQIVRGIILDTNAKAEEDKSAATKRFLTSLDQQRTKDGIIMLVWNARMKGDGLGVC